MTRKRPEDLRSARWFARDDFRSFGQRSRMNQMGYSAADYAGKPIVGIINTWSDLNQCHAHFKQRVEDVKRGVFQAGGFPVELPAISLSETNVKPTTMLYRNFLAMETEELIRSHPVDGAVLMGGCDKTTPGLLLGATSAGVPAIFTPAGPMLRGNWHGKVLGSGSDLIKYWEERRAGTVSSKDLSEIELGIARSYGVGKKLWGLDRVTFLIDSKGRVAKVWPSVDPAQHFIEIAPVLQMQPHNTDGGVGLVHGSIGSDAQIMFRAALAVAERRGAVIAGSRVDTIEHDHCPSPSMPHQPYREHGDDDRGKLQQHPQPHQILRPVRRSAP